MQLKDYELTEGNHFVAMEYYNLIFNRTFLVLITDQYLIGVKVNGMVSVEAGVDNLVRSATRAMAIKGDLQNPYAYMKNSYLNQLVDLDIYGEDIINVQKPNFKISRSEIESVSYDSRKKWGMGYYPHDGKVYVVTKNGKKKEFIILGAQSGKEIENWIEGKVSADGY